MNSLTKQLGVLGLGLGLTVGACVTTSFPAPKELVQARAEYARATQTSAMQLNPDGMRVAKMALDDAEMSYGAEKYEIVQDRAEIALKRTQAAEANARAIYLRQKADETNRRVTALKAQRAESAESNLRNTQEQLESERQAREQAEQQAKEAMDRLASVANVRKDARGTVITLSGSVFFASGQSTLLPSATRALENLAIALKASGNTASTANIVIEGHTDSRGKRDYNMELSQARADSVRTFLASRGVPAEKLRTVGVGPDHPVASNASAEGRANNRRVEIVLPPPSPSTAQMTR